MTQPKIWSIVSYDGRNLVVVPQYQNKPSCLGCFFSNASRQAMGQNEFTCYMHGFACTANTRRDGRHVIFIPY